MCREVTPYPEVGAVGKSAVLQAGNAVCLLTMLCLLCLAPAALALDPIGDEELGGLVAQEGIALGIELRLNTDASGSPLPDATLTQCGSTGTVFSSSECRFAISFEGRTDEWLLFRGIYGFIDIEEINLDAGILHVAGTPAGYFDATRFQDPAGACLLPTGTCTNDFLRGRPSLLFEYPSTVTSYNSATGLSSGYDSLRLGLGIKESIVVFGNDAFDSTQPGSFLGVNIADNDGGAAGIAIRGQGYVYGF